MTDWVVALPTTKLTDSGTGPIQNRKIPTPMNPSPNWRTRRPTMGLMSSGPIIGMKRRKIDR